MAKEMIGGILYRCDGPGCAVEEVFPVADRIGRPKLAGWIEAEGKVYHERECYAHGDPDEERAHILDEMIAALNAYRQGRFIDHATDRAGEYFDVIAGRSAREYTVTLTPRD